MAQSRKRANALSRLEAWLKRHRPRYYRALLPRATAAVLDALPTRLGIPLPADLRRLLAWHNGQRADFPGKFEQDWRLMSAEEIVAAKSEMDSDGPDGWDPTWIPFLDDDAGDYLFLDSREPNGPVRAFWLGQRQQPIVSPSLSAWLEDFVAALERGEYVEDPERGTFMRQAND